jgi:hypothetical protein
MRRAFLVILLCYETLDYANPLLPGAVNFNDDYTVYGLSAARDVENPRLVGVPVALPQPVFGPNERAAVAPLRSPLASRIERLAVRHHRSAHPPGADPPSAADDH